MDDTIRARGIKKALEEQISEGNDVLYLSPQDWCFFLSTYNESIIEHYLHNGFLYYAGKIAYTFKGRKVITPDADHNS